MKPQICKLFNTKILHLYNLILGTKKKTSGAALQFRNQQYFSFCQLVYLVQLTIYLSLDNKKIRLMKNAHLSGAGALIQSEPVSLVRSWRASRVSAAAH